MIKKITMDEKKLAEILKRHENAPLFTTADVLKNNAMKPFFKDEIDKLRKVADDAIGNTTTTVTFEEYYRVEETGYPTEYHTKMFERRRRVLALTMIYLITEEQKYLTALQNELWVFCNEYVWATPTELRGHSHTKEGWNGIPHHQHLDLCSTENAFMFAELLHIIGDKFAEIVVHRLETEIDRRMLSHYADNPHPFWWEDCDNNWAAVCGGSCACTAMYMIKDADRLAHYLTRAMKTLENFINGYGEDGESVEGVSYWGYGFSNFIFFADMLRQRTEGEIDILGGEHCHQISLYMQRSRIDGQFVMNFGDCGPTLGFRSGMMHKLKAIYPDVNIPEYKYAMGFGGDHCFRFAGFIRDYAWFDERFTNTEKVLCDGHYFKDPQIFTSRKNNVFFAAIGGNNGYNHNHNDVGHFLYFVKDTGFFVDMGQGIYCIQYFGPERYTFRPANADGHSLPKVGGCEQQGGAQYMATRVDYTRGDTDTFNLGLEKTYECKSLERLDRKFMHENDGTLIINDSFILNESNEIIEQFLVDTETMPEFVDGSIALVNNGVKVEIFVGDGIEFYEAEKISTDIMSSKIRQGLYMIKFKYSGEKGENSLTFIIKKAAE